METLGLNEAGQKLIYLVRGFRNQERRSAMLYEGRIQGSASSRSLTCEWLSENEMDHRWRKLNVNRKPGAWFRVPVGSIDKQLPRNNADACSLFPSCAVTSVAKAFDYMGLTKKKKALLQSNFIKSAFGDVAGKIQILKGFHCTRIKSVSTFDLVRDVERERMYLIQIRAKNSRNCFTDNTHAICIFHKLIFDVNNDNPLRLSQVNLDHCCLGGCCCWVHDDALRVLMFTPTKAVFTNILSRNIYELQL